MDGLGHRVDHRPVPLRGLGLPVFVLGHQLDAEVRLVPHLPIADARQTVKATGVALCRGCCEIGERRRARSNRPVARTLLPAVLGPTRCAVDEEHGRESCRDHGANLLVERGPRIERVAGISRFESRRLGVSTGSDPVPVQRETHQARSRRFDATEGDTSAWIRRDERVEERGIEWPLERQLPARGTWRQPQKDED